MSLPYYKIFPADHLGNYNEMSMTDEQLGCYYRLVILQMWQHQGHITDDPQYIAPLLRMTPEAWEKRRREFLDRGLIQTIDGKITDAALRMRWVDAREYSETQSSKRKGTLQKRRERELLRKKK